MRVRGLLAAVAVALAATGSGVALLGRAPAAPQGVVQAPRAPHPSASADRSGASHFRSTRTLATVADPVAVRIPGIGVTSRLQRLGLLPDGTLRPPTHWQSAGWYTGSPRPGQLGSSVLLGHVDSTAGPAVFYRLRELRRGDPILVDRADGTVARFRVTRVATYPKTHFPTSEVYYPTLAAELRLVTCGGEFDPRAGHYRSNVIAFASAR